MPTTARPALYPQVALTPTGTYQQPPSGVIVSGFALGDLFPARWGNWLFRGYHDWVRGFDEQALRGSDGLDTAVVQRLSANPLAWALGSGLGPLAPTSGAVYIVGGERVDLSDAPTAYAAAGQTFAPSTTNYVHVRPQPALTGPLPSSTQGQILVSTNTSEAGYGRVLDVLTDGTDITNITETAGVVPGFKWSLAHTFDAAAITSFSFDNAVGSGVAGFTTLTLFPGTATTTCLSASGSTSVRMVEVVNGGSGSAVYGRNSSTGRGVEGSSAGSGSAIYGAATGTGKAGEFVGNANATALVASAGAGQIAVDGDGGAGSGVAGVRGTAGGNTARGLHGRSSLAAGTGQEGVYGEGRATGARGVVGDTSGADGHALVASAKVSSPTYPALFITPQAAAPSSQSNGGVYVDSTSGQIKHAYFGTGWRSVLSYYPGSACHAVALQAVGATATNNSGVLTTLLTATLDSAKGNGFYGQAVGAQVEITFTADVRTGGAADYLQLEVRDITNGWTIQTLTGAGSGAAAAPYLSAAVSDWQGRVALSWIYSPPADGSLSIRISYARLTATIVVRNARLQVRSLNT